MEMQKEDLPPYDLPSCHIYIRKHLPRENSFSLPGIDLIYMKPPEEPAGPQE